jgi:hypothetical protein
METSGQTAKILAKIKKCLALSASSNEHEAAVALNQAQALMKKYNLSHKDVAASTVGESKIRSSAHTRPSLWEHNLAITCAKAFGCELFLERESRLARQKHWIGNVEVDKKGFWKFIGVGSAPELSLYAFTVLSRQIRKGRAAFLKPLAHCKKTTRTRQADIYCAAYVDAIYKTVGNFANGVDQDAIDSYMDKHYRDIQSKETSKPTNRIPKQWTEGDVRALYSGKADGKNARILRPIDGNGQSGLLESA